MNETNRSKAWFKTNAKVIIVEINRNGRDNLEYRITGHCKLIPVQFLDHLSPLDPSRCISGLLQSIRFLLANSGHSAGSFKNVMDMREYVNSLGLS